MSDDDDKGGMVIGSIGFGVDKPALADAASTEPTAAPANDAPAGAASKAALPLDDQLLPLRVIAVVDLLPDDEHNAGARAPERTIAIEPGHFDALFKALRPRVAIKVDSVLAEGAVERMELAPVAMKSFRPDGLLAEVPLLRSLHEGRRVLERLRDGSLDLNGAREELDRLWSHAPLVARVLGGVRSPRQSPAAPSGRAAAPSSSADVARILDMVGDGGGGDGDAPSPSPPAPAPPGGGGRFDALISAVAHSGKNHAGWRPDTAIGLLDEALSLQLGAIVQHPEIRRLEQAWRSMSFLAQRTPKRDVQLEVLCCPAERAADALDQALVASAHLAPPVSLAIVDDSIGGDAVSLARWRSLSDVAEQWALPTITNAAPALLGHDDLDSIDRLDNKQALFDARGQAPWRAAAGRPAALWVALAMNRVLARMPYDRKSSRVRDAEVQELPPAGGTVWMQPCWAVASLVMRSFAATGWPCRVTGARDGGIVEDLPVRQVAVSGSQEQIAIPTEVFFSTETQRALGRLGLVALASQPNSDAAYLLSAATSYVPPPKRTQDGDTAEPELRYPRTPLGDQLFVARLAHLLRACGQRVAGETDERAVADSLEANLREALAVAPPPGPELTLQVTPSEGGLSASVTIHPRRFLGVQMEEITLGVPLS